MDIYEYKWSCDILKEELKEFKFMLWERYGMKPEYKHNGKRVYITCHAYSLEEKNYYKQLLFQAHNFFIKSYIY